MLVRLRCVVPDSLDLLPSSVRQTSKISATWPKTSRRPRSFFLRTTSVRLGRFSLLLTPSSPKVRLFPSPLALSPRSGSAHDTPSPSLALPPPTRPNSTRQRSYPLPRLRISRRSQTMCDRGDGGELPCERDQEAEDLYWAGVERFFCSS